MYFPIVWEEKNNPNYSFTDSDSSKKDITKPVKIIARKYGNHHCNICQRDFKTLKELNYHQRTTHRKFSETAHGFHKCEQCGEQFSTQVCIQYTH